MLKIELKYLLMGLVGAWAVCCVYSRGPAILVYIAMQAATSGVFAWAILNSLKKHNATAAAQRQDDVLQLKSGPAEAVRTQIQGTQAG